MRRFKEILRAEDKKIAAALHREMERLHPAAQPLAAHVINAGGKRVRPLLTVLTAGSFGCRDSMVYALAGAVELLHGASLMHDDILDGAELRRGAPATHKAFGTARTILAGDVLFAAAMRIVLRSRDFEIIDSVAEATERTAAGEVEEINNLRNPELDFADYLRIITGKTAWLIRCACLIGAARAGAPPEGKLAAADFGLNLGLAFQLVDDALDVEPELVTGKPTGNDLREGKTTPLLRLYLETLNSLERDDFLRKFRLAALSEAEIEDAARRMRESGCATRARALAGEYLRQAESSLEFFPAGRDRDILRAITGYIRDRDH